MSEDRWADRLSDYLDGHLDEAESAALDVHLQACARCREVLVDLEALTGAAGRLEAPPPPRDLWPGIAERIRADVPGVLPLEERRAPRRAMARLAAAALAAVALGGTALWLTRGGVPAPAPAAVERSTGTDVSLVALPAVEEGDYEVALQHLERTLRERSGQLDPATVRVIEESMAIIDAALDEALEALQRDPGSAYLNRHYDATMRRKIDLMRRAADATRAVS